MDREPAFLGWVCEVMPGVSFRFMNHLGQGVQDGVPVDKSTLGPTQSC